MPVTVATETLKSGERRLRAYEDGLDTMNAPPEYPVLTKRLVIGQVTVCRGCCCGNTERGLPEVPVEWLKSEWRKRGLLKRVQLTISGCVGPCDVPNVVVITSAAGSEWLGNIHHLSQYRSLLEWAIKFRDQGVALELPPELQQCRVSPFLPAAPQSQRVRRDANI